MDYAKLKIITDGMHPLTGAYSANNEIAAAQGNLVNCEEEVDAVSGQDIFEASTVADRAALSADQRAEFYAIVGMGMILVNGTNTKAALLEMFGSGTDTRANLGASQKRAVSHFQKEGLGFAYPGHIQDARRM